MATALSIYWKRAGFHTGFLSGSFFKDGKHKLNHALNSTHNSHIKSATCMPLAVYRFFKTWGQGGVVPPIGSTDLYGPTVRGRAKG